MLKMESGYDVTWGWIEVMLTRAVDLVHSKYTQEYNWTDVSSIESAEIK